MERCAARSLGDLAADYGADLLGMGNDPAAGLPLLAKLIDASAWLSIQVHPNDEQARALEKEPRGKTEAWVILHAEPGAKLVIGLERGTTRERMAEAIGRGQLEALLAYAEVKSGDVLYIPANTIHALGPGILIYEIQQSSDVTYRLYDWAGGAWTGSRANCTLTRACRWPISIRSRRCGSRRTSSSSMANSSAPGVMRSTARNAFSKPTGAFNR